MPRLVRSLAIVAALAGGGYFALVAYAQEQLRGEIEQLLRQLPPGFSGGYDSLDVSPLARRATATGFTLKNAGRGFEFTARSVEIEDVSPGLAAGWARAIASPAAFDATTALAVAGTIVLRDVAYRSSDSSAKWSLATIADLDIYPGVLLAPRATPSPAAPNLAAMDEAMRAQAVEGLSVGFASFVIDDVAATSQMPGPNGASRTVATYARRVATEGFTPGRLDTATVEDLKVTSDGAEILTAEAATLADIDIVAALRRILAGEAITPDTFNGLSIGRMDYTGLAYRPVGDVGGSMERLTLANLTFADGVRASLSLSILGLRGDAQAIAGLGVDPADLGIDDPAVDFGLDFAVDMAAKRASLRTLEFELRGLGRVEVSVELIDATQDLDPQTTKIEGARLRYVDSSLLERVLTLIGASPDEIADEVRNNGRALGNTPAAVAAVQAVVAFVLAPRSITLEMRPPRPPSLALLRATPPTALVATTGLRITANQ